MRHFIRVLFVVAVALAFSACKPTITRVLLTVDSDIPVPAGLSRLVIDVSDQNGTPLHHSDRNLVAAGTEHYFVDYDELPVKYGIDCRDESTSITVVMKGYAPTATTPFITQTDVIELVQKKEISRTVVLSRTAHPDSDGGVPDAAVENDAGVSDMAVDMSAPLDMQIDMQIATDMQVATDMRIVDATPDVNVIDMSSDASVSLPSIAQQAYVKASNTGANDQFGTTIALSADGNTLVVGAAYEASNGVESDNSASESGAVYVFTRSGSTWTQQAYLKAFNSDAEDRFGFSVALSADGNVLAVGAPRDDSHSIDPWNNDASNSGAAYVFRRTDGTWVLQTYVKASNVESGDEFGTVVALSGDGTTLAVGAINEDSAAMGVGGLQSDNTALTSGAVYVFTYTSGTSWPQQAYVKASNTGASDRFGTSLALSTDGRTLVVGAPYEASSATGIGGDQSSNAASSSGAAYVFTRSSSTWTQQAYVKAANTGAGDQFGGSVALARDGDMLAIGARYESSNGRGLSADPFDDSAGNSGAVYVFMRSSGTWTQTVYLKASNTNEGDNFGNSVALASDGSALAVGAFLEASNATGIDGDQTNNAYESSGAVYRFLYSGLTTWSQSYVKASNTFRGDAFGNAVALSSDGSTLAVGTAGEDSNATGVGGDQLNNDAMESGATYVFYGR